MAHGAWPPNSSAMECQSTAKRRANTCKRWTCSRSTRVAEERRVGCDRTPTCRVGDAGDGVDQQGAVVVHCHLQAALGSGLDQLVDSFLDALLNGVHDRSPLMSTRPRLLARGRDTRHRLGSFLSGSYNASLWRAWGALRARTVLPLTAVDPRSPVGCFG
jgi:hypothetical protein